MESMNAELWVNLGAIVALGTFLWRSQKAMGDRFDHAIGEIRRDIGDLRERMARLEGLFAGAGRRDKASDG